jgi:hypothetical protein
LLGRNDGESRIRAGRLRVREGGRVLAFEVEPPAPDSGEDIYARRLNTTGAVLDFGDVRTDGSVLARREKGEWVLRAMPRNGDFVIELGAARFGRPATVRCVDGSSLEEEPEARGDWWRLRLNGAREYRWQ